MESDFNSKLFAKILKKYTVWILLVAVIGGALAFAITCTIPPVYSASASFYVTNIQIEGDKVAGFTQNALVSAAQALSKGYIEIIRSDITLNKVAAELKESYGYDYTAGRLRSMLAGDSETESEVFTITVRCSDRVAADRILRSVEKYAPKVIDSTVLRENCIVLLSGVSTSRAEGETENTLSKQVSPNKISNTVIGVAAGLILSFVCFSFVAVSDRTIRVEEDIKNRYSIPLLGKVPRWTKNG